MSRHVVPDSRARRPEGTRSKAGRAGSWYHAAVCLRQLNVTEDGHAGTEISNVQKRKVAIEQDLVICTFQTVVYVIWHILFDFGICDICVLSLSSWSVELISGMVCGLSVTPH